MSAFTQLQLELHINIQQLEKQNYFQIQDMNTYLTDFERDSPKKIINSVWKFTKTYDQFYQSPKSAKKKQQLDQFANYKKQKVVASVEKQKKQRSVYRTLQIQDAERRRQAQQKLQKKYQKANKVTLENKDKRDQKIQKVKKHVKQVLKKYSQNVNDEWQSRVEKLNNLDDDKLKYFQQRVQRRKSSDLKLQKMTPVYPKAQQKILAKLRRSRQFSRQSEERVKSSSEKSLKKRRQISEQKLQSLKKAHQHKYNTFEVNKTLFESKERSFVQMYAQDMQLCLKAAQQRQNMRNSRSKKIQQHFKKKIEKWSQQKRRLEEKQAELPQRCQLAMNRTIDNLSHRKTFSSSFNKTTQQWRKNQEKNKQMIEHRKNEHYEILMERQRDQTLKNKAQQGIQKKMESMRMKAVKLVNDYL